MATHKLTEIAKTKALAFYPEDDKKLKYLKKKLGKSESEIVRELIQKAYHDQKRKSR